MAWNISPSWHCIARLKILTKWRWFEKWAGVVGFFIWGGRICVPWWEESSHQHIKFRETTDLQNVVFDLSDHLWPAQFSHMFIPLHRTLLVATDSDRRTCESLSHTGYGSRVVWFGRACSWAGLFVADGWKHLKACPFVNPQTLFFWKPKKNRKLRDFPCIFLLLL